MLSRREFLATAGAAALAPAARATMIDSHVHVFCRTPEFPYAVGSKPPAKDAPVEDLLALMRANGIAHTVLIQVIHYRWDNSYVADVLKRYPGVFHAVCRVNPEDPAAPDHLSALTQQGFHGVRLSPAATAEGDWIRGPLMSPLWRRCAQLRVPMTILTAPPRLPDLIPHIEANPDLDVVIDHMAECPLDDPAQWKLLLALARYPRVYLKVSGLWTVSRQPYPYRDTEPRLRLLIDTFGTDRLMAATNWPVSLAQLTYAQAADLYRNHLPNLSNAERQQILSGTANKLWPF